MGGHRSVQRRMKPVPETDHRIPYEVAASVVRAIAQLSPLLRDEDSVMEAILEAAGPARREYLEAMTRTGHSIFYEDMQRLYEFGKEQVKADARDRLCLVAGRRFADEFFDETLRPLLRAALEARGTFRFTLKKMMRTYMTHYSHGRYDLAAEMDASAIEFRVAYASPDSTRKYLTQYGIDPRRAFENSAGFIAGAIEGLTSHLVENYDASGFRLEIRGEVAVFRVPVRDSDRFAYDPLIGKLLRYIDELEARRRAAAVNERLESDLIVGAEGMRRTWDLLRRASGTREIVLLRGESGTGKSFLARKIHEMSERASGPFVEVALTSDVGTDDLVQAHLFGHERGAFTGAVGEKNGLFALADGGTILLDEIGDASREVQARLLRVLESSTFRRVGGAHDVHVDVRVIAATNRDLESMVEEGEFRRDLYYRLCVIPIVLPPLRERPEDVAALAEFLLARAHADGRCERRRLSPPLAARLAAYGWPGNIRELDHALKYAATMASGEEIRAEDFPGPVRAALAGAPRTGDERSAAASARSAAIVDEPALRRAIRDADLGRGRGPVASPAHVAEAKRVWLGALIDELDGDLSRIGRFWDRSSEKTLRALVREYGLSDRLAVARARARRT